MQGLLYNISYALFVLIVNRKVIFLYNTQQTKAHNLNNASAGFFTIQYRHYFYAKKLANPPSFL